MSSRRQQTQLSLFDMLAEMETLCLCLSVCWNGEKDIFTALPASFFFQGLRMKGEQEQIALKFYRAFPSGRHRRGQRSL